MYYIYFHYLENRDLPFYIGMGTKNLDKTTHKQIYRRAYSKSGRNTIWHSYTKNIPYTIKIVEEIEGLDTCLKRETELIDFYGRIIENNGILVNIVREDSEIKELAYIATRERVKSIRKKVYKYSLEGDFIEEYDGLKLAAKENNVEICSIWNAIKKRTKTSANYQWSYDKVNKLNNILDKDIGKNIYQYDLEGNFVKKWKSSKEASKFYNIAASGIRNNLANLSESCCGYIWSYENISKKKEYRLEVKTISGDFVGYYYTFSQAERELNLPSNLISTSLQRNEKHRKYVFIDLKPFNYKEKLKNDK
jgi:hypothetical protein